VKGLKVKDELRPFEKKGFGIETGPFLERCGSIRKKVCEGTGRKDCGALS